MKNTTENIMREKLIKKYHEYGFAKFMGEDLLILKYEIDVLEELVKTICANNGTDFKEFILERGEDG
ncbi:hypothetical protein [Staphylococcus succinus]|uniref:hypothetical protein n=1 Tax=Staphylococcus succinus TaxID=61015 RepID=UPI00301BEBAE